MRTPSGSGDAVDLGRWSVAAVDPAEPAPELAPGSLIDQYEVVALIGMGAMGRVYRVRHRLLGREYALKMLAAQGSSPVQAQRLLREAQATARIEHPHVVRVVYSGTTGPGQVYLVMELLAGRPLSEILRDGPLAPARAGHILRQVALGLAEIHRLGLLHRDIKPSNIMVGEEAGREQAKILDLGLVGFLESPEEAKLTQAGHVMGTPMYMAPETLGAAGFSTQSDLYALGAVLYEMLAGRPPFVGNLKDLLWAHHMSTPDALPASGGLEEVAFRLLEKRPARRPASALDVATEVERRMGGLSLLSRLREAPARWRRGLTRALTPRSPEATNWALVALTALLFLAGGLAAWGTLSRGAPTAEPAVAAGPAERSEVESGAAAVIPASTAPASDAPRRATASGTLASSAANAGAGAGRADSTAPGQVPPALERVTPAAPAEHAGAVPRRGEPAPPDPPGAIRPRRARARTTEVLLTSDPPGAEVEAEGGILGRTPLSAALPMGRTVALRFRLEGHGGAERVLPRNRRPARLHVRLTPRGAP